MRSPKKRKSADNPSHYWCSVPGCASDGRKKANLDVYPWMQGVQFHPYPGPKRQPKLRRQWLQQVFRDENYSPKRYHSVCSLHFVDGCPTENNPVPTLFPRNNFKNPKNVRKSTSIAKRQSAESSTSTDSVSVSQNSHSTERIAVNITCLNFTDVLISKKKNCGPTIYRCHLYKYKQGANLYLYYHRDNFIAIDIPVLHAINMMKAYIHV